MHFKTESKETFHFLQEPPGIKDSDDDIEGYGTILIILNIYSTFEHEIAVTPPLDKFN